MGLLVGEALTKSKKPECPARGDVFILKRVASAQATELLRDAVKFLSKTKKAFGFYPEPL